MSLVQDGIRNAKTNITLASLYIGTEGKADTAVIGALECAATKCEAERPQITILLDALRSTRPSKDPKGKTYSRVTLPQRNHTAPELLDCFTLGAAYSGIIPVAGQLTSTALMLGKVLFPDFANEKSSRIYLFHTPALRGMLKRCSLVLTNLIACRLPIINSIIKIAQQGSVI